LLLAACLLPSAACAPGTRTAGDAILPYLEAVQDEELDALYCLSAGARNADELGATAEARRRNFDEWATSRYGAYLEGRDAGRVDLDGHGITLVKLFSLGRGTFFTLGSPRRAGEGAMRVRSDLRFGYRRVDLSRMSPGTTFYLCGAPAGLVHPVRVPSVPEEVTLEVLESVSVEWTLVWSEASENCPAGWTIANAEAIPGSESSTEMTWAF
jgi:hypothetical protein